MILTRSYRWLPLLILLFTFSFILSLFLGSCATKPPAEKPSSATVEEPYRFETEGKIPPLEEKDITEEVDFEEVPVTEEEVLEEDVEAPRLETLPGSQSASEMMEGFRVQVFATASEETAEAVREAAERKIGIPVYSELVEGLYKVRVGNCLSREEAEALIEKCKGAGYGDAWIVETLVFVAPKAQ